MNECGAIIDSFSQWSSLEINSNIHQSQWKERNVALHEGVKKEMPEFVNSVNRHHLEHIHVVDSGAINIDLTGADDATTHIFVPLK